MKDYSITNIKQILTIGREWQIYNFGHIENWKPATGLIEEMGELAHAILKKAPGIREYTNYTGTDFALLDALADATIYLAQYASMEKLQFPEVIGWKNNPYEHEHQLLFSAISDVGALLDPNRNEAPTKKQIHVDIILEMLSAIANIHGRELEELTVEVWNKTVAPRDWKTYPETGRPPK